LVVAAVIPDFDHVFAWDPKYWMRILPLQFWQSIAWNLRVMPMQLNLIAHDWMWPLVFFVPSLALWRVNRPAALILLMLAVGWSLHLVLDGVIC